MQLAQISQCAKDYDFKPLSVWPEALPAIAIDQQLLCGFTQQQGPALNQQKTKAENFLQVFKAIYPELSLSELARILQNPKLLTALGGSSFLKAYGVQNSDLNLSTLHKLSLCPLEFQHWCSDKKVGTQDLGVLRGVEPRSAPQIFVFLSESRLSKSDGIQALEWSLELYLIGTPVEKILQQPQSWIEHLRTLRFPTTNKLAEQKKSTLSVLKWPLNSVARWVRRGDRSGIELKLFFSTPTEMHKSIESLHALYQESQQNPQLQKDLWTPDC